MPVLPASGYAVPVAPTVEPLAASPTPYQEIKGVTAEAFGGATGEALSRLGGQFGQAGDRFENIQSFYDQVAADEQINSFEDNLNKLLYGDPSKPGDVGYMGLQGRSAMDQRENTRKMIDQQINDQRSKITSLRQQHLFDQQTRRYRNYALSAIGRHYDDQFNKWTTSTAENTANLAINRGAVAANNNDFGGFKEALGAAVNSLTMAMRDKPPEETAVAVQKLTKGMAVNWARTRIEKDPVEAEKFIEENKDHLGDAYDDLLRASRTKALDMKADDIISGRKTQRPSNLIRGGAVQQRVSNEAAAQGVSDRLALTTASIESDFGQSPDRPGSQYEGVFQIGNDEGRALGGKGIEHGVALLKQRKRELAQRLGREPEDWEVYLAHNQGVAGATSLLHNPSMSAGDAILQAGGRRINISSNFKGNPDAPASAFTQAVKDKFNERAARIVKVAEEGAVPKRTEAQQQAFVEYNKANPTATLSWQEFLSRQPTSTDKGVDTLIQNMPPQEQGELPDAEVPGLVDFLKQKAKDIPPNADPKLWPSVVKKARQLYNMEYQAKQQKHRLDVQAQQKTDQEVTNEYVNRMYTPGSIPSEAEIGTDKRLSAAAKEHTIAFLRSTNKTDPRPETSRQNQLEALRRMGLPDTDAEAITTEKQIRDMAINKLVTFDDYRELRSEFQGMAQTRDADRRREITRITTAARAIIDPMHTIAGSDPTGANAARWTAYSNFVEGKVRENKDDPKALRKMFDPSPGNTEYIGSPEVIRKFTATGEIGKQINELFAAQKQAQALPEMKSLPDVLAAWKAGKFGPYGDETSRLRAMEHAAKLGFGTIGPATGAPVR